MRRYIKQGFARAALLGDESELANFLTYGFAELDFKVRPSRQDLVLALFKVLMEVFLGLKIPVVVAWISSKICCSRAAPTTATASPRRLRRHRPDDAPDRRICFLIFAERGSVNRFVPSLDGYIQDRLNNPVHVPGHGTIKALRLEAPLPNWCGAVGRARLPLVPGGSAGSERTVGHFSVHRGAVSRVARTRADAARHAPAVPPLFDHLVLWRGRSPRSLTAESPSTVAPVVAAPLARGAHAACARPPRRR